MSRCTFDSYDSVRKIPDPFLSRALVSPWMCEPGLWYHPLPHSFLVTLGVALRCSWISLAVAFQDTSSASRQLPSKALPVLVINLPALNLYLRNKKRINFSSAWLFFQTYCGLSLFPVSYLRPFLQFSWASQCPPGPSPWNLLQLGPALPLVWTPT